MTFIGEIWRFLRARKKFWLLPIIMITVALGGILVLAHGSAVAPFSSVLNLSTRWSKTASRSSMSMSR